MLKLDVPLVAQAKSDTCWHASAMMIWQYWQAKTGKAGPMYSLYDKWQANQPISPQEFVELAKRVGLKPALSKVKRQYTGQSLQDLLISNGPLWCAGHWFGPGHIIVLTGIKNELIYFNDPDGGKKKFESVAWFNTKLAAQFSGCMMAKNPDAY